LRRKWFSEHHLDGACISFLARLSRGNREAEKYVESGKYVESVKDVEIGKDVETGQGVVPGANASLSCRLVHRISNIALYSGPSYRTTSKCHTDQDRRVRLYEPKGRNHPADHQGLWNACPPATWSNHHGLVSERLIVAERHDLEMFDAAQVSTFPCDSTHMSDRTCVEVRDWDVQTLDAESGINF
jgi:hypothetical protein